MNGPEDSPPVKAAVRVLTKAVVERSIELPLGLSRLPAGFPSPAEDYLENSLDIATYLARHPTATFFMNVDGDSMRNAGINDGDLVIIDRAAHIGDGAIILARVDGGFCCEAASVNRGEAVALSKE